MNAERIETLSDDARPGLWRGALIVIAVAVLLAELESLQFWLEQRPPITRDNFAFISTRTMPAWLVLAAMVPLVAWLCRRVPLSRWRWLPVHAAASLAFPVFHMIGLALVHRVLGDQSALGWRVLNLLGFHYVFDVLAYWGIAGACSLWYRRHQERRDTRTPAPFRSQFIVRDAGAMQLVPVDAVDWIEARNYCVRLHTRDGRHLIRESLNRIEAGLDPAAFARIHRSTIVRLDRVAGARLENGKPIVELRDGMVLAASRSRWSRLKQRLGATVAGLLVLALPLRAQATRTWREGDRVLVTDLSYVTAVAATPNVIYAATPNGLAVYDRALGNWRRTVGPLEAFPGSRITAMAADPGDDTAWLAMPGRWAAWDPFTHRLDSGTLPGQVDQVVLDARNPSRGAWFHTSAGWYEVARGSIVAMPARDLPAPGNRVGGMSGRELMSRLPALDAVRLRIERDDQMRTYRMTSAAMTPVTNEIVIGTDGNGTWRVDPVTYLATRLPAGLSGSLVTAVTQARGQVCAAAEATTFAPRHGIACFDENAGGFTYVETTGLATLPAGATHRLLVTERAIWAATDQGLLRAPRRGGRAVLVTTREGLPSSRVWALAPAPEGVYAGTGGGLALVADTGRGVVVGAVARGPDVLAIAGLSEDTLWAGTAAGVVGFLLPLGGPVVRPAQSPATHAPVTALAMRGSELLAAATATIMLRAADGWRTVTLPGPDPGRITDILADASGFWIAGERGVGFYETTHGTWTPLVSADDVPLPVRAVAASRDYLWVGTDLGVVRYEKRIFMP